MPIVTVDQTRLFYRLEGNDSLPVLILSNSLGTDHGMWDSQMPDLLRYFRVLRYDTRGHGASDVPTANYSIEGLAKDVLGLADALGIGQFAFCGLSLGGMIGQWLGAHKPGRLTRLVLACTSPRMAPASSWDDRRKAVLEGGMAALVDAVMQRWFSPETIADPHACSVRRMFLSTNPAGYAGCCEAIRDMDHTGLLEKIRVPTMIIVGDRDPATSWTGHGEVLAAGIRDARLVRLPAAHIANIERPRSFTNALFDFLLHKPANLLEAGLEMRRAALGSEYVDAAMSKRTELTREFQDMITRFAWGGIWTRPGLDRRTRRLLVLVITAALGRWEEFRLHARAALARELEPCDVKEALLQTAVYAGLPAANTAFHIVEEETGKHA